MSIEVKRSVNWLLVLTDALMGSLFGLTPIFFNPFENMLNFLLLAIVFTLFITLWRLQSHKIVIGDQVYFKRLLLADHVVAFEDIIEIKIYDVKRSRPLSLKRSFLEVDTKKRYFLYFLDHFDMEEVYEVLNTSELRSKVKIN